MFGYIRPYAPELKVREYQYYRGVYCGLCRAMGRCTGQCSRMTLSYDLVFLALARLALAGGNPQGEQTERPVRFERRRCLPHPFRRRLSLEAGDVADYVACVSAVLGYHKTVDDRTDERSFKRARAVLTLPSFRCFYRRAERKYHGAGDAILPHLKRLADVEKDGTPSADEPADAFGEVLGTLFAYDLPADRARIAHHIGFHIGRWLYLVDAIDDFAEDLRRGRPNPLIRLYDESGLTDEHREQLRYALLAELRHAVDALDLLDIDENTCGKELSPLLYHMLETALPAATERVLFPAAPSEEQKKVSNDI